MTRIANVALCLFVLIAVASPPGPRCEAPKADEPTVVIEGVVNDAQGKPVAGATVMAASERLAPAPRAEARRRPTPERQAEQKPVHLAEAKTDDTGAFRLEAVGTAPFRVRAEAKDLAPAVLKEVAPGSPLTIVLGPGLALEGQVLDRDNGRPLEGAEIAARELGSAPLAEPADPDRFVRKTTTDADGRFKLLHLASDDYLVNISAPGKASIGDRRVSVGYEGTSAKPLMFQLRPGVTIAGKVVDEAGKPVAKAAVRVQPGEAPESLGGLDDWAGGPGTSGKTDDKGAFELQGIPVWRSYVVEVSHKEYATAWVGDLKVASGHRSAPVTVTLGKGTTLSGTLLVGDQPFEGSLSLFLRYEGGKLPKLFGGRWIQRATNTPEQPLELKKGGFKAERLPAGTANLTLTPEGYREVAREKVVLKSGEPLDLEQILLERGPSITGRVVDDQGNGVSGARVTAEAVMAGASGTVTSGADGSFVIGNLKDGLSFALDASSDERGHGTLKDVKTGATPVTVKLSPTASIRGRAVTGDPPAPVESFAVEIHPKAQEGPAGFLAAAGIGLNRQDFRDATGRFEMKRVDSGTVTVKVSADGFIPASLEGIEVPAGGTAELGDVKLNRGATVHGVVIDKNTRMPVSAASVGIEEGGVFGMMRQMSGNRGKEILTGPDGRFELRGLAPGPHTIQADHEQYAAGKAEARIEAGILDSDVTIELGQGGTIEGVVRGPNGIPQAGQIVIATSGMSVSRRATAVTDEAGHFRIPHLTPGTYVVVSVSPPEKSDTAAADAMAGMKMQSANVEEGRTVVVNLPPSQGGLVLKGKVRSGRKTIEARLFWIKTSPGSRAPVDVASCTSSSDGSFEVRLGGSGKYKVTVQKLDANPPTAGLALSVDVPERPIVEQDLVLPQSAIAGRVVDGDTSAPLPHARVSALRLAEDGEVDPADPVGASDSAGEDGEYRLDGLSKGRYRIVAALQGYGTETLGRLELGEDDEKKDQNVALRKARTVTIRVSGDGDTPVQGAFVLDQDLFLASAGQLEGLSDMDGKVVLSSLQDGTHDLVGLAPGYAPATVRGVTVGPDGPPEVRINLSRGGKVVVRAMDAGGKPASGLALRVKEAGGRDITPAVQMLMVLSNQGFSLATDAGGSLTIPALDSGSYELTLLRGEEKLASKSFKVVAGQQTDVEVKLP